MTLRSRLVWLLGILFLLPPSSSQQCSDKCWFVDHPPDTISQTDSSHPDFLVSVPPDKEITGVITVDSDVLWDNVGEDKDPRVIFRFMKTDLEQPLVVAINDRPKHDTQLVIWGEINGQKEIEFGKQHKLTLFPNSNVRIQITDRNITSEESYQLFVNGQHLSYNYLSATRWERFENTSLNTTTQIKYTDALNWNRYNFISVCSDPKPVLCDAEHVTFNAVLGAEYTLSCSGSGAPYLSSRWDNKETYRPTIIETYEEVLDNTTADNFMQSTLKISAFTVDHIGTWTCAISNLDFQETVQKTYQFHYSEPVTLMTRPSIETYNPAENTSLIWIVEGWPLDQIRLKCDYSSVEADGIHRDTSQFYTRHPPRLAITLVLTSVTTQDQINCRLLDSDMPLDSVVISKVGYNCRIGQYGEGKLCLDCPRGETSLPASTRCFPVNNSCPQDQFGEGEDCRICPWGTVTFPKDMAVKEHDCIKVLKSICSPGEYGYLSSGCQACPLRSTSLRGAAKFQDCTTVTGFCRKQGFWGEKDNCQRCPENHTSDIDAVKIQDCYPVKSYCSAGYFGIDKNCAPCPNGMTSHSYTASVMGCFEDHGTDKSIMTIDIMGTYMLFVVIVTLVCICVSCVTFKKNLRLQFEEILQKKLVTNTILLGVVNIGKLGLNYRYHMIPFSILITFTAMITTCLYRSPKQYRENHIFQISNLGNSQEASGFFSFFVVLGGLLIHTLCKKVYERRMGIYHSKENSCPQTCRHNIYCEIWHLCNYVLVLGIIIMGCFQQSYNKPFHSFGLVLLIIGFLPSVVSDIFQSALYPWFSISRPTPSNRKAVIILCVAQLLVIVMIIITSTAFYFNNELAKKLWNAGEEAELKRLNMTECPELHLVIPLTMKESVTYRYPCKSKALWDVDDPGWEEYKRSAWCLMIAVTLLVIYPFFYLFELEVERPKEPKSTPIKYSAISCKIEIDGLPEAEIPRIP